MERSVLVAGLGDLSSGDEGFGIEVARALHGEHLPEEIRVSEFAARSALWSQEIFTDVHWLIVVDAIRRGSLPGTLHFIEPEPDELVAAIDTSTHPKQLRALIDSIGSLPRVTIIGCEPRTCAPRDGLTARVSASVPRAVGWVKELLDLESTLERAANERAG